MKSQVKQWFLYGTLFSALGFVVSGSDPQLEGHIQLSSNERVPADAAATVAKPISDAQRAKLLLEAKAKAAAAAAPTEDAAAKEAREAKEAAAKLEADKKKVAPEATVTRAPAPQATDTIKTSAALTITPAAQSARVALQRGTPSPQTAIAPIAPKGEQTDVDTVYVEDKSYRVIMKHKNGKTEVIYYLPTEGKEDCNDCRTEHSQEYNGPYDIAQIKKSLETNVIPGKLKEAAKKKANKDDDDEEVESAGAKMLTKKVTNQCKHLSNNAELECKTKKFIEALKAGKKVAKTKGKDKDGKKRIITDDDAKAFFTEDIKDFLKEMLTHKFQVPVVSTAITDLYESRSVLKEYEQEKRQALKEKTLAKNLIKELMRSIDGEYKDTRKEVASLYKESLETQKDEVKQNILDIAMARKSNDTLGFQTGLGSYAENFSFLRSLDTDLYSAMFDSLKYANRTGYMDGTSYREILNDVNSSHTDILRYLNNPNPMTSVDGIMPARISDAARRGNGAGRGNANGAGTGIIVNGLSGRGSRL